MALLRLLDSDGSRAPLRGPAASRSSWWLGEDGCAAGLSWATLLLHLVLGPLRVISPAEVVRLVHVAAPGSMRVETAASLGLSQDLGGHPSAVICWSKHHRPTRVQGKET